MRKHIPVFFRQGILVILMTLLVVTGAICWTSCSGEQHQPVIANLYISPQVAAILQEITIRVDVRNFSRNDNRFNIKLEIKGNERDSKEISVAGNGVEMCYFTVKESEADTYPVEVIYPYRDGSSPSLQFDKLSGQYVVTDTGTSTSTSTTSATSTSTTTTTTTSTTFATTTSTPSTISFSPINVKWNLSGALMPVPPYGSRDVPGSDTSSALEVDQTVTGIKIIGRMRGLYPATSYTVYLAKASTPTTFDLNLFRTTVPPVPFTTDSSGASDWQMDIVNANFPGPGTYTLALIINETIPNKSMLISDTFDVTIR